MARKAESKQVSEQRCNTIYEMKRAGMRKYEIVTHFQMRKKNKLESIPKRRGFKFKASSRAK